MGGGAGVRLERVCSNWCQRQLSALERLNNVVIHQPYGAKTKKPPLLGRPDMAVKRQLRLSSQHESLCRYLEIPPGPGFEALQRFV